MKTITFRRQPYALKAACDMTRDETQELAAIVDEFAAGNGDRAFARALTVFFTPPVTLQEFQAARPEEQDALLDEMQLENWTAPTRTYPEPEDGGTIQ